MCALDIEGSNFGEVCHFTANELEAVGALDLDDSNSLVSFLTFRREQVISVCFVNISHFHFRHARNNTPKYNWIRKLTVTGRDGVASLFQREPPSRSCSTGAIDASRQQKLQENYSRAYDSFCQQDSNHLGPSIQIDSVRKKSESVLLSKGNHSPVALNVPEYQPLLTVPQDPIQRSSFQSYEALSDISDSDDDNGILENGECIQILVGRAGIFKTTKFIFIRLNTPLVDKHLTKSKIPIKFFFLIIGPRENNETFLEMGRVIASMCANKQFLTNLYRLVSTEEILTGFDSVLNDTMIIPPIEVSIFNFE